VYKNFNNISGIAFLPFSEHSYKQPPYQECTEDEYKKMVLPENVDWAELSKFETDDNTEGSQILACSTPQGCEI